MKRIVTLALAAGLLFGAVSGAGAVDFKAKGQWIVGFGLVDSAFATKARGERTEDADADKFAALQRLRLQMDAVASESLSGTVYFEIGDTIWGKADAGGALGADGRVVEVKSAYIDWVVPNTELKFRMGIQGVGLPNVAGGSAVFDNDVAGVTAHYKFNDALGLTAVWMRPYNDNYAALKKNQDGLLDNVDVFALTLPVTLQNGFSLTPWVAAGMLGKNSLVENDGDKLLIPANDLSYGLLPYQMDEDGLDKINRSRRPYDTVFFAGLPMAFTGLDPWNFELDINYGYSQGIGSAEAFDSKHKIARRADSRREGWLAKALVEYKMDWGTPGLFGWYGSGDDGDVKNGSERMPTLSPSGNFTSFMGDGPERGWSISGANTGYDLMLTYAGTWGLGAQLKDMSFLEGLSHTFRAAYWRGSNSPSMARYYDVAAASEHRGTTSGFYLTTNDYLLEFNLDSTYQIYDNLTATLELGYIVNGIDKGTWNPDWRNDSLSKSDAYKAALIFNYSF